MVRVKKGNLIGLVALVLALSVGSVWLGIRVVDVERENKALRSTPCSQPEFEEAECLELVFKKPVFEDMALEGAIFKEGVCSKGSKAPVCRICGDDLSKYGRHMLTRRLLGMEK